MSINSGDRRQSASFESVTAAKRLVTARRGVPVQLDQLLLTLRGRDICRLHTLQWLQTLKDASWLFFFFKPPSRQIINMVLQPLD